MLNHLVISAAAAGSPVGARRAAYAKKGININGAVFVLMTSRTLPSHRLVVRTWSYQAKSPTVAGQCPPASACSQWRARSSRPTASSFAAGIARPVAFLRFLQLAAQANARETEGVGLIIVIF